MAAGSLPETPGAEERRAGRLKQPNHHQTTASRSETGTRLQRISTWPAFRLAIVWPTIVAVASIVSATRYSRPVYVPTL